MPLAIFGPPFVALTVITPVGLKLVAPIAQRIAPRSITTLNLEQPGDLRVEHHHEEALTVEHRDVPRIESQRKADANARKGRRVNHMANVDRDVDGAVTAHCSAIAVLLHCLAEVVEHN